VLIINGAKHWNGEERITGKLNANEVIFRLKAPGEQMISNVSESHGLIKVGETKTIDVDITTENLYNGDHSQRLTIFSNDPFRNPVTYTVSTSVTGGVPDLVIETDTIDFGQVFQGGNRSGIAIMRNLGTDKVDVTNLSLATSNFTFNGEQPYTIVPKSSYLVDIQLNTANKGVFEDALAISCSDNEVYKVVLKGEVIPAPDININVLGLSDTLEAGDKMVKEITITNNGEAKLELVAGGNDWLYIDEGAQPANTILKDFTYYVMDSNDEGGPEYNWENILEDGTRIAPEWYGDRGKLYQKIALPFEFSFYNEPCDTMWLSYEGFLTLKEPETEPWYIYPTFIPDTEDPNGIIAPYWTPHNPDLYNINYDTTVGVFYKFFEDRIVITWSNYIDFYGMGWPYSVQVILYKNGNIKYQYQRGLMSVTSLGVIGVENMDGTDGVQVSAFQDYVENRFAISLTPSEKINIAVGESRTLPIALDASYLNKGVFNGNLHLQNNVPKKEDIMVPVALTVNGEPELEVVDTIRFGDAMVYDIYTDFGLEKKTYYKEFELKNTGRANIDFTRVLLNNRIETNLEWQTIDENNFLIWENVPRRLDPLIPGESIKLRVSLQPSGTIIPLTDSVRIISNLSTEDIYIPVTANVIFPPVNSTPEDTIRVVANDRSHVETRTFVLDNTLGQSPLKYDLSLSFLRDGNPVSNAVVDSKAKAIPELLKTRSFDGSEDVASVMSANEEQFNQTLEYSSEELPYTNIGYGEDRPFIAATTFEAPESGFNLTHITTWYSPDVLLNSRLTVEIRGGGTSISDARILSTNDYQINLDQAIEDGGWLTLELPENQIFYPGELFYVVFRYQLGIPNPQGLVEGQINVEGRYMYEVDGAWYDLQYSYPGWGWMMKAHEKESKGGAWATINEDVSGAVPAGETKTINVEFDASLTLEEDNKGLITVSTNDPVKTESIIGLLLSLNRGPEYDLGTSLPLKIDENDTLSHKIHAKDIEGDQYTISLAEAYEQVSIRHANDTITFVYTPDFESSGLQTFTIVGEDAFGNLSELDIEVMVNNVNRVPEIITPIMDRVYRMPDDENENFNLLDVFNDPDGQDLSFTVIDHVEGILTIYKAEGMMSLSPITIGTTQLDIVATDPEGASATMSFIVDVFMRTAIDKNNWTADVSMYPNPVNNNLNITILNDESTAGEIRLLNTLGTVVDIIPLSKQTRHDCKVNMSKYVNGLYYVQIQLGDKTTVRKVIKK
jgi:hypothetical protein